MIVHIHFEIDLLQSALLPSHMNEYVNFCDLPITQTMEATQPLHLIETMGGRRPQTTHLHLKWSPAGDTEAPSPTHLRPEFIHTEVTFVI